MPSPVQNVAKVHHAHIGAIQRRIRLLNVAVLYILVVDCQWDVQVEPKYTHRLDSSPFTGIVVANVVIHGGGGRCVDGIFHS
ncbi:unnamed protein product [Linum trigynum]|uniref:Uncharacterized protein n=1 Tax=Linum trigynum TaxID=586398 RepID=A0AAV2CV23_9ROSI